MAHNPSFHHLYGRSRYSVADVDASTAGSTGHNQSEVFAVAALGFALHHERKFLAHFLRKVCHFSDFDATGKYEILCQDGHKSDLAIRLPGKRVIVVEAKIDAPLTEIQNPTLPGFRDSPTGYGVQIKKAYHDENDRYYLVLLRDLDAIAMGTSKTEDPKFLGFHQWGELEGMANEPAVVTDLLDSLGNLGIPELHLRHFKNMKRQNSTKKAAEIFSLLSTLARAFKIGGGTSRWEVSAELQYMGINIPPGGRFTQLSKRVGSSVANIGWFGYEHPPGGKPRTTVWFYPENRASKKNTQDYVRQKVNRNDFKEDGNTFYIDRPDEPKLDDQKWFRDVLAKLADKLRQPAPWT